MPRGAGVRFNKKKSSGVPVSRAKRKPLKTGIAKMKEARKAGRGRYGRRKSPTPSRQSTPPMPDMSADLGTGGDVSGMM
jgi:hypothetical protein